MLITLNEIEYLCEKYKLTCEPIKYDEKDGIALVVSSPIFEFCNPNTLLLARHVHKKCYRICYEFMKIDFVYGLRKGKTPLHLVGTKQHTFFKELDLDLEKLLNQIRLNEEYRKELYLERKKIEMEADFDCK